MIIALCFENKIKLLKVKLLPRQKMEITKKTIKLVMAEQTVVCPGSGRLLCGEEESSVVTIILWVNTELIAQKKQYAIREGHVALYTNIQRQMYKELADCGCLELATGGGWEVRGGGDVNN